MKKARKSWWEMKIGKHHILITAICLAVLLNPMGRPCRACTSFCLAAPDGPVIASNLDFLVQADGLIFVNRRGMAKENTRRNTNGETLKWVSKFGSVTFNIAGRELVWSGMNEAGLVITGLELATSELSEADDRPPFDIGRWTQYVLDTCGSVADLIQAARRTRIVVDGDAAPTHFLAADAGGNSVGLEYLEGRLVVYTGQDMPVKAMSNMPYALALEAYNRGGPRWWWSNPGRSAERFAAAADRMASYDSSTAPSAMGYALETLAYVVSLPWTKWSVVYDIAKREIWFGSAVSPAVKSLSLNHLDMSCHAPLLMLDVDTAAGGNVEDRFVPYDSDVNLNHFRTFCKRYKLDISEEDIMGFISIVDNFKCAPSKSGIE